MIEIYKITNVINGKCYIGQTKNGAYKRFQQHSKADSLIGRAIRKHGSDNFMVEVLDSTDKDNANSLESFHIKENNSCVPFGYNIAPEGRLVGGLTKDFFYIGVKPSYYKEVILDSGNLTIYLMRALFLANKNFVIMKNQKIPVKTWGQLFEAIGSNCRYSSSRLKKYIDEKDIMIKTKDGIILNKEKFKKIYD